MIGRNDVQIVNINFDWNSHRNQELRKTRNLKSHEKIKLS